MNKAISDNDKTNLFLSLTETKNLDQRVIRCPYCKFKLYTVFEDATGHLTVKCAKCKRTMVINLEYFRSIKRSHRYSHY